jgi:hypothetical protein
MMRPRLRTSMLIIFLIFFGPILARTALYAMSDAPRSYRDADWSSTGLLAKASEEKRARVMVLTGTTGAWKGIFSVHSWVVYKRAGDARWTRYDVVGWGNPLRENNWPPDGRWYGNAPAIVADIAGAQAEHLIPRIETVARDYAYAEPGDYRIFPGPNSNSFTAAVLRAVPELGIALPSNAIGRDYRDGFYAGTTDSGTGIELNAAGYAGIKIGWIEGVEVNLLGLVAGFDIRRPAVKLPGFGRIGVPAPISTAMAK